MTSTPQLSTQDMRVVASEYRASRRRKFEAPILGLLGILILIAIMEIAPLTGLVDPRFMPPATEIFASFFTMLTRPAFWFALSNTLLTWALGLAIAMVLGIVLGIFIGSFSVVREFTASTIEFLRPIPSVALIPLVVLLFGTDRISTLILVVYAAFWQVLVQVLSGVADVDPVAHDTTRSYHFRFTTVAYRLIWPTALPYVVTGFRLAATVALILTLTGELIIGTPGLGQQIFVAQSSGAVSLMYALILAAGFLGVLVNIGARAVEKKSLFWHPSVRRDDNA